MGKHKPSSSGQAESVKVVVRSRPLNSKEKEAGYKSCVSLDLAEGTVAVNHVVGDSDRWTFDAVVNNTLSQRDIFVQVATPLIDNVLGGFNATIFAYGQSGSGKTFTMMGDPASEEIMGIIPRTFQYVFDTARKEQDTHPGRKYSMACSYVELYNNKTRDLLADKQETLEVKENKDKSFFVKGAQIPKCRSVEELQAHIDEGTKRRQTASTELNDDSSRSHSIFSLLVEMLETSEDGDVRSVSSKLNLVDLAGSERQSKTGATGDTLKEGCNINLSLSNLGTVIDCIVKAKPHIPFRSNPLTMLLKDSLGGNSKTCMFANINPSEHNSAETVSTLRFADRAKQIKNKPVVCLDVKDQKIQELMDAVHEMKEKLKLFEGSGLQGLEEELEETKEKLGDTEVQLENAEKGRETDRSEFLERLQHVESERDEISKATKELQLSLDGLKGEKEIVEQRLGSESKRRAEWKQMLTIELGLPPPPPPTPPPAQGEGEEGEQEEAEKSPITKEEDADTIEKVLEGIRQVKNTYIDPVVHESKVSEIDTRRKNAESEVATLNAAVDSLKQQLSEMSMDFEQATKKSDRLKEKLDREKESRRQMDDFAGAGVGGVSTANAIGGISPTRSISFRRPSMMDLRSGSISGNNTVVASSTAAASASENNNGFAGAMNTEQVQQLTADVSSKESIIENLRQQIASNTELEVLQQELDRMKEHGEDMKSKMEEQISSLTASVSAPTENDSQRDALLKKALLSKDAALQAAMLQVSQLEKRIGTLLDMRRSVAVGDVRVIEGDVIRHQAELRENLVSHLDTMAEHRNKLLQLLSSASSSENSSENLQEEIKAEIEKIVEENEKLRKQEKPSSVVDEAFKAEATALRAALIDQKRAGTEAVSLTSKQTEELQTKISQLEQDIEKSQENALEIFLAEHSKNKKKKEKKEGDGENEEDEEEEEEEDPLRTVLNVLQREKSALSHDLNLLSRELQNAKVELALNSGVVVPSSVEQQQQQHQQGGDTLETSIISSNHNHEEASFEALRAECLRLRALLNVTAATHAASSPGGVKSPSALSGSGKSPTAASSSAVSRVTMDEGGTPALDFSNVNINNVGQVGMDLDLNASFAEIEQSIQNQVQIANQQATDLRDEVDTVREELQEANDRRDAALKERSSAQTEASDLKQQVLQLSQSLDDNKSRVTELEEESQKQKSQLEQQFSKQILSLESRLRERTDQLAEQKKLVESQTTVANNQKERTEMMQQQLTKLTKETEEREEKLNDQLDHQETQFQKLVTKRLEEQKERHQQLLIQKDEEMYDLRKKMKKMEDKMDKIRQQFDEKICEYEEMSSAFEDLKIEAMKNMMHGGSGGSGSGIGGGGGGSSSSANGSSSAVVQDGREKVGDAIKSAREARNAKKDAFENADPMMMGKNAAAIARIRKEVGHSGGTPPTSEEFGLDRNAQASSHAASARGTGSSSNPISTTSSSSSSNTARRIVVSNESYRGGGTGYTGYVAPSSNLTNQHAPNSPALAPLPLAPLPPPGGGRPGDAAPMRNPSAFTGTFSIGGGQQIKKDLHGKEGGGGDDDMYYF